MTIANVSKQKQLKEASKHYASCLFGDLERALQRDCKPKSYSLSWSKDCKNDSLKVKDIARLKRHIKRELKHRLKHFRYYSRRFKLDAIAVDVDLAKCKLIMSGLVVVRED